MPVFNTVAEAVAKAGPIDCSLIFVPAPGAADAILEAADSQIKVIICITEGIPTVDMMAVKRALRGSRPHADRPQLPRRDHARTSAASASCPATSSCKGRVGVVSRSGTLVYEAVDQLTRLGIGQSTCVGVGGDPIIGTTQRQVLEMFNNDPRDRTPS